MYKPASNYLATESPPGPDPEQRDTFRTHTGKTGARRREGLMLLSRLHYQSVIANLTTTPTLSSVHCGCDRDHRLTSWGY